MPGGGDGAPGQWKDKPARCLGGALRRGPAAFVFQRPPPRLRCGGPRRAGIVRRESPVYRRREPPALAPPPGASAGIAGSGRSAGRAPRSRRVAGVDPPSQQPGACRDPAQARLARVGRAVPARSGEPLANEPGESPGIAARLLRRFDSGEENF